MAASDQGVAELDPATMALRRLLSCAAEDERARVQALLALLDVRVLAATWPGSAEAVRTLTNSDGEQAMPLFSAGDALASAARRFGWTNPDGSMSSRELDAREAFASALSQGVHFVVLDICAEHSVEFARDEIAQVLAQQTSVTREDQVPAIEPPEVASTRQPVRLAQVPIVSASRRTAPLLGEIDLPFGKDRGTGRVPLVVEEVVVPRQKRSVQRRDPRADPVSDRALPTVAARAVVPAPQTAGLPMIAAPALVPAFAPPVLPAADFPPADAPEWPAAKGPPSFDELPMLESLPAAPLQADGPRFGVGFGFDAPGAEPEARPAALEAAVMVTQLAKMAGDQATKQAAAEVAAMLKDMALKGGVEEPPPNAAPSAASALASMLTAELTADAQRGKRRRRGKSETAIEVAAVPEPPQPSAPEKAALGPPREPLGDAVLNPIAEALRKYPEVEWACELSDGSTGPVIGVRVVPTFLTRVGEIEAAVVSAGASQKTRVTVLLLNDAQQMREARAQGHAFFPWRKKR